VASCAVLLSIQFIASNSAHRPVPISIYQRLQMERQNYGYKIRKMIYVEMINKYEKYLIAPVSGRVKTERRHKTPVTESIVSFGAQ
jgi:hypothetical protein